MTNDPEDIGGGSDLSAIGDIVGDIVTGIPAPIRKNALKAFGRLCSVAVEYPAALIQNAIDERRALSQARVKLIDTSASQIAKLMETDPEYARVASAKYAEKILRERVNVDRISSFAAAELRAEPDAASTDKEPEAPPISDDWLNAFENEGAQMSSEQMQILFGKILAGEIRRPTTYSMRTLKLVGQLDNRAADLFTLLCSLAVSIQPSNSNILLDARVVSMGNAASNSLAAYGLPFDALNILHEYGLIISDYNSWLDYGPVISPDGKVAGPLSMRHQKAQWTLVPKGARPIINVHGVSFSRAGKELLPIVEIRSAEQYTAALKNFFDKQGMTMTQVLSG
jgi:hypothetical protein